MSGPGPARPVVAAFDFDGTLTRRDTLLPFLAAAVGWPRVLAALARSSPAILRAARDRDRRDLAKATLVRRCLAGRDAAFLDAVAAAYVPSIPLRDDVLTLLDAHLEAGHEVVVVSASPAVYVRPAAQRLGAHDVVATELEVVEGVMTGRFASGNCRAEEKRRRLEAWLDGRDVELHAYGDSVDDEPMLALAAHPFRV